MKVLPNHPLLQYSGRIDFENQYEPEFIYPCSFVKVRFTGTSIRVYISNKNECWENYLGFILDGKQEKIHLSKASGEQAFTLADGMADTAHELLLFKRMDSCHTFRLHSIELDGQALLLPPGEKPVRRIEVYGDSVSAGEVSEAVEFAGQPDPEWHNGEYSNSWYSYAWILARRLGAELHNQAQGGIPLLNQTGWFAAPHYLGMESVYDKLQYNPGLGAAKLWDFSNYRPHLVIVALGQNDNHPEDYMKADYNSAKAVYWRRRYRAFAETLRGIYPKAHIILKTTILEHDKSWDIAIAEVCRELKDEKIHHFLYTRNGRGTPGHIRIPEAEEMADELAAFIETLGETVWEDEA